MSERSPFLEVTDLPKVTAEYKATRRQSILDAAQAVFVDKGYQLATIDYIASRDIGDASETRAIKAAFGEHAYSLAVSSTKSMTGHLLGAAAGAEAAFTALALFHQILPPTINQEVRDRVCELDYVPDAARPAAVRAALSNSFGFGGTNISLAFKRWD